MGILYKNEKHVTISVEIKQTDEEIELEFFADCGKFRAHECLSGYRLTPRRLLQILSERSDYLNSEL